MINRHIARQGFILNDQFSSGRNPDKILNYTSQMFPTSVALTSTQTQTESGTEVLQMQAECIYKFAHTKLVQVSMILNESAHVLLNLKKTQQTIKKTKLIQVHKKNWEC